MEEFEDAQFYVPNSGKIWKFVDHNAMKITDEDLDKMKTGIADYYQLVGLCDHSNVNENMKNLLCELNISEKSSESLEAIIKNFSGIVHKHKALNLIHQRPPQGQFDINNDIMIQIIYEIYYLKKKESIVARKYDLDLWIVRHLLTLFRRNLNSIKADNRRFLNKRKKVDGNIVKLIKEYWHSQRLNSFTINDLRLYLRDRQGGGWDVSKSTLARVLRKEIGMSYKKVNKIHPKVVIEENKRKILEAASIQIKLIEEGTTVVYVDEFKYSCHRSGMYGWAFKGKSGYRKLIPGKFQATFIVAVSMKKIHGVLSTTKTIDSQVFKYFLCRLAQSMDENYAIVCDNSKVHVSKLIQDFLKEHKLWIITIPAYCPWVNAWEKLILNVKTRVRKYEREGNEITLMIIKRWLDSIKPSELGQWVIKSYRDVLCLLN